MIIDLHTHTTHSDGNCSVSELLQKASEKNIDILAITDHDCVEAHIELMDNKLNTTFTGKIIVGTELNAMFEEAKIELLGYNFDAKTVKEWLNKKYNKQMQEENFNKEFQKLVDACYKNKIIIDKQVICDWESELPIGTIFIEIKKHKENRNKFTEDEWSNSESFYRSCTCNKNFPLYVSFANSTPTAKECSEVIRAAGGKVFLAHLHKYNLENHIEFLNKIVNENIIDGVEVYYPKFSDEQIDVLEEYCETNKLFMSGGSDFHGRTSDSGEGDAWIKLKHLRLKEKNIFKWINK